MALDIKISSGSGNGLLADVVEEKLKGLLVYAERREKVGVNLSARNASGSTNIAIDASPASTELINDGGDTSAWTGAATGNVVLTSTTQAFTGTQSVEWPTGQQTSEAQFTRPSGTLTTGSGKSFTGAIYLDTVPAGADVEIRLFLSGVAQTAWTSIGSSIDFGVVGEWQQFDYASSLLGTVTFDRVDVRKRVNGTIFFLDIFSFADTGGTTNSLFNLQPRNSNLNNTEIALKEIDIYIESSTDTTLINAATNNINPTKFGSLAALTNGIQVSVIQNDNVLENFVIRDNRDLLTQRSPTVQSGGDAASSWMLFTYKLPEDIKIVAGDGNKILVRVSEDLTGFDNIQILGRGSIDPLDVI